MATRSVGSCCVRPKQEALHKDASVVITFDGPSNLTVNHGQPDL
jgi:hypothetical protein